jgi:regulator of protease activity HflC (stomatin/prohibitin superfamily)
MEDLTGLIVVIVIALLGLWLLFSIVHIVREYERLVVFFFGRLKGHGDRASCSSSRSCSRR